MKNLDGDPVRYPLLSERNRVQKNGPLSVSIAYALSGDDGFFRKGDVVNHTSLLFDRGSSFPSHKQTEIGRWDHRDACEIEFPFEVPADMYYAWVDPDLWDYDPYCVFYTKAEFMNLFEDCCRNFVVAQPDRRIEFEQALNAHGMSL